MSGSRQPWDRRADETGKAFAAFQTFLEQPGRTRSIAEAGRRTYGPRGVQRNGNVVGRIRDWAEDNEWEVRARAWDEHLAAQKRQKWEDETAAMTVRHAEEAAMLERAMMLPAIAMLERLDDPVDGPKVLDELKKMSVEQLGRLMDRLGRGHALVSRFERLSRGMADGRTEVTGKDGGPVEVMTTEVARSVLAPVLGVDEDAVVDMLAERRKAARRRERELEREVGT